MLKALTTASIKSKRLIRTWTYQTLTLMLQPRPSFNSSYPIIRMIYLLMMFLAVERKLTLRTLPITLLCKRRTSRIPLFSSRFFFFFYKHPCRTMLTILSIICIHYPLRAFIYFCLPIILLASLFRNFFAMSPSCLICLCCQCLFRPLNLFYG